MAAGARKQDGERLEARVDRVLSGVAFRNCEDHMFWTRKIQNWVCSRSVEE